MRVLLALLIACGSESASPPANDTPVTADLMPQIPGGKVITVVHEAHRGLSGSWCVDDADPVKPIVKQLGTEGWTGIETRDEKTSTGALHHWIAAKRDTLRFSAQLYSGHHRCGGTVVNATVKRILEVF